MDSNKILKTEAEALISKMANIACKHGTMHVYWDVIFDMRSYLEGGKTLLNFDLKEYIDYVKNILIEDGYELD